MKPAFTTTFVLPLVSSHLDWLSNLSGRLGRIMTVRKTQVLAQKDLRHLAQVSPHLLEDVGFICRKVEGHIRSETWCHPTSGLELVMNFPKCEPHVEVRHTSNGVDR